MEIYEYGNPNANIVLIQPVANHDMSYTENEAEAIKALSLSETDFRLIAVKVNNWNNDLSPWKAPAVFRKEDFGGAALDTLTEILKLTADKNKSYYIGGYSLAGLFALWVSYQTDVFSGVVAASPSIWFPDFIDYMKCHDIKVPKVYLSLGDREKKTKNSVMSTVSKCIREAHEHLLETGVDTILEWNPGNHFKEPDVRTAKGFAWVIRKTSMKR